MKKYRVIKTTMVQQFDDQDMAKDFMDEMILQHPHATFKIVEVQE